MHRGVHSRVSCGDGLVNNVGTEDCEPPNTGVCDAGCRVRIPICGDGFLTPPEECEDGNVGGRAMAAPRFCIIELLGACGDGNLDPGEECDDGNAASGDGCAADCSLRRRRRPHSGRLGHCLGDRADRRRKTRISK